MFHTTIEPRIGDTDAIGHINNTVAACWFEQARNPLFRIFMPVFDSKQWNLIMVRTTFDFLAQMYFTSPVEIKSWVSHIGTKSFTVTHEAWQLGQCGVRGTAVIVYFDYVNQQSQPIPEAYRARLMEHFIAPEPDAKPQARA